MRLIIPGAASLQIVNRLYAAQRRARRKITKRSRNNGSGRPLRARKVRSDAETSLAALSSAAAPADQAIGDKILLEKTAKAVDALPEIYREVLAMVVIGGASYQETADAFDIPVGTVMSRLARARAALAEEVGYHG